MAVNSWEEMSDGMNHPGESFFDVQAVIYPGKYIYLRLIPYYEQRKVGCNIPAPGFLM